MLESPPAYMLKNIRLAWEAPHDTPSRFLHEEDDSLGLRVVGVVDVEAISQTQSPFSWSTASESRKCNNPLPASRMSIFFS